MVAVYRAAEEIEARVIESLLKSYGISCLLRSEVAASVHLFTVDGMGEVRVMVKESMAERSRSLIAGKDDV